MTVLKAAAQQAALQREKEEKEAAGQFITGRCHICGKSLAGTGMLFYCARHAGPRKICRDDLVEQIASIQVGEMIRIVPEHECEFYTEQAEAPSGMPVRELPKIVMGKKTYYFDDRLRQLRNVETPDDWYDLASDETTVLSIVIGLSPPDKPIVIDQKDVKAFLDSRAAAQPG